MAFNVRHFISSSCVFLIGFAASAQASPTAAGLQGLMTASAEWTRVQDLAWPAQLSTRQPRIQIKRGQKLGVEIAAYVNKMDGVATDLQAVQGRLCLVNPGSELEAGAPITAQVQFQENGEWKDLSGASQALDPGQPLAPGEQRCIPYRIETTFKPESRYRVQARMEGASGWQAGFQLPSQPGSIVKDLSGHAKLEWACPTFLECEPTVFESGFSETTGFNWTVQLRNTSAVCGQEFKTKAKLTVTESDTQQTHSLEQVFQVSTGNCSDGTFVRSWEYPFETAPGTIALADFNGDSVLDAVGSLPDQKKLAILLGEGDGIFQPAEFVTLESRMSSLVTGDFNSDGKMDIVGTSSVGPQIVILLGKGDGKFEVPHRVGMKDVPRSLAAGDFNRDGKLDLAAATGSLYNLTLFYGRGDGDFRKSRDFSVGGVYNTMLVQDINQDGNPDLIAVSGPSQSLVTLLGDGNGDFREPLYLTTASTPTSAAIADFNQDGKLDVAVSSYNDHRIEIFEGRGNGRYNKSGFAVTANGPRAVVAGDFDRNGTVDLAASCFLGNRMSVHFGRGDNTFDPAQLYGDVSAPLAMVSGDLNGDGKLDFLVSNTKSQSIGVWLGQ